MSGFMIGDCPLFDRVKNERFALKAANDTFNSLLKVLQCNSGGVAPCSCDSLVYVPLGSHTKYSPIRAASLTQLAMLAPAKPGVSEASRPLKYSMSSLVTIFFK